MYPAQPPGVGQAMPDTGSSEFVISPFRRPVRRSLTYRRGITLVEMLIAVAITLVMMAAVVTVFANISDSVQKRRAVVEMSNSLRHARNILQRDLAGATCPTIPWQRPESNHGYLEIIEGPACDFSPSILTDADLTNGELDYVTSVVPSSNLLQQNINAGIIPAGSVTDGRALGDFDDILMLTVRNEREPFVGRVPANVVDGNGEQRQFVQWTNATLRSPLAEVVWFAVENPPEQLNQSGYFGEPGFRTIYRRTLLIAPSLDLGIVVNNVRMGPGVVRVIPRLQREENLDLALACLVAFQERYDLSVRLEWDPLIPAWKIVANTLADLTKRENRFEHHGYLFKSGSDSTRVYPFTAASVGGGYNSDSQLRFVVDPEIGAAAANAQGLAIAGTDPNADFIQQVVLDQDNRGEGYRIRPFVYVNDSNATAPATVRALVHKAGVEPEEQQVVYVTAGMVPLGGDRRGEDVMLTDALAFDVRVYDPGAPILGNDAAPDVVVEPGDAGWSQYLLPSAPGTTLVFGYGAYVDLGYLGLHSIWQNEPLSTQFGMLDRRLDPQFAGAPRVRSGLNLWGQADPFYEHYRVYDTWSFHYENNGVDEDSDGLVDEGTNGFDDEGIYIDSDGNEYRAVQFGVDDPGERETAPPYDVPLRGLQVRLRAYERDSRQVREVGVKQHFVPE